MASGRESKRAGASGVDRQAARCRAGVRDKEEAVGAGIVGMFRKGKERDKKGSRERDTGGRDSTQWAARDTGRRGEGAKGRGLRVVMGTWAQGCSQGRDWDVGEA